MDGTGFLFQPLLELLNEEIEATVVNLNDIPYEQVVDSIINKMGDSKYVVLAESFSGHIAYEVAKRVPNQIEKLVIAASFLSRPSTLTYLRKFLPLVLLKRKVLPAEIVSRIAFGRSGAKELVSSFYSALNEVSDEIIRQRLDIVHALDVER